VDSRTFVFKEPTMAKTRPSYTPEFRRQMVELVRAGRSPEELAQEFELTAQSIRNWVGQAECDAGRRGNGLTTAEREELNQVWCENRHSGSRGMSSQKPRPGLLGRRTRSRRRVPVRERESGRFPDRHHVPAAGCLPQRLLCVDEAATVAACSERCRAGRRDPRPHSASRGTYGTPRIHVELAAKGIRVGRKRVARLMSAAGLAGVSRRKFVHMTVKGSDRQAPDLVERNFTAERPNLLWVADITYIPTWAGFLYLAVVLDAYSRRIVGG
jgi:transposase-like protein